MIDILQTLATYFTNKFITYPSFLFLNSYNNIFYKNTQIFTLNFKILETS